MNIFAARPIGAAPQARCRPVLRPLSPRSPAAVQAAPNRLGVKRAPPAGAGKFINPRVKSVVQGVLIHQNDRMFVETRSGQEFRWIADGVYEDSDGNAYFYTSTHQYQDMFGGYYDPVSRATLDAPVNGWYSNQANQTYYWYDGTNYQPYVAPQQTAWVPQPVHQPQPVYVPQPQPTAPALSQTTQTPAAKSSGGMSNSDFARLFSQPRPQTMFDRVGQETTLTGKLKRLEAEAGASDANLEAAIDELAHGTHARASTLRSLSGRFSDERFVGTHEGHAHAELITFQLFERLLQRWTLRGKNPKREWTALQLHCRKAGFDLKPDQRKDGDGDGGGSFGGLGGPTKSQHTRVGVLY